MCYIYGHVESRTTHKYKATQFVHDTKIYSLYCFYFSRPKQKRI